MSGARKRKAIDGLSRPAKALYDRVCDSTRFYVWDHKPSRYMQELIDAGLIGSIGRVVVIKLCFVPAGTKPFKMEEFPK